MTFPGSGYVYSTSHGFSLVEWVSNTIKKTIGYLINSLATTAPVGTPCLADQCFPVASMLAKTTDVFSPHQPALHLAVLWKLTSRKRAS